MTNELDSTNEALRHQELGRIYQASGKFDAAADSFRQAIDHAPHSPLLFYELGVAYNLLGQHELAKRAYEESIALLPDNPDAYFNLGFSLHALDETKAAQEAYRAAIQFRPQYSEAYNNLGKLLLQDGQHETALEAFRSAIAIRTDFAEAHFNLALAFHECHALSEALQAYVRALELQPSFAEAANNLGNVYKLQGDYSRAIEAYRQAITIRPSFADAHYNLGISLNLLRKPDLAIESFQQALAIRPDHPESHLNMAVSFQELGRTDAAINAYRRAYQLRPGYGAVSLLHQMQHLCDWQDLDTLTEEVIAIADRDDDSCQHQEIAPLTFLSLPIATTAEQQWRCARKWVKRYSTSSPRKSPVAGRPRFRIGYLSSDFGTHPVSYLIAELLEVHDRQRFEIFGYTLSPSDGSLLGQRIEKSFDRYQSLENLPFEQAAERIAHDQIDILVDLQGYTRGAKTEILALRPAPIQVNYLGFAGTMGADFIDYILVDDFVVPDHQQPYFSERLVHLPQCFMVNDRFRQIDPRTPSRREAGLPERGFVFCAFSAAFKITPSMFELWLRLLQAIPDSVLWLRLGNPKAVANLQAFALAHGVSNDRLIFSPTISMPEHLARHRLADLYLDTFPYNQHSTASDAIRMGVPLITIAGSTFASRVAGSLLRAVGMTELITDTFEAYKALAVRLASQPNELADIRRRLAANLERNPLYDGRAFAKKLEETYQSLIEKGEEV